MSCSPAASPEIAHLRIDPGEGSGGHSRKHGWFGARPAESLQAPAARLRRGRPPTRRGRVGGFHWCPGHRGCRVTAHVTALRRNLVPTTCRSTVAADDGMERTTIASCEARADVALGLPKALPIRRRGCPCHGGRCVVAAGPSPFPPVRVRESKWRANAIKRFNRAGLLLTAQPHLARMAC
jgi:hypothetical protein